jgi:transposase
VRLATVFRRLLRIQGVRVCDVQLDAGALTIFVDIERLVRPLRCSRCGGQSRRGIYDRRQRLWRHLDFGAWEVYLRGEVRRFRCRRCERVVTEAVPWADHGAAFTRDFENVAAYLAQQTSKTAVCRLMGIAWPTVGNIVARTVRRYLPPLRTRRLYAIGIDEVSYRKGHRYLTLVADHLRGQVVWGAEGRSGETLAGFFDAIGEDACKQIGIISVDMCEAYLTEIRRRAPQATIVIDPFHVVKLANDAIDEVRRAQVRALKGQDAARAVKKTRWLLLKRPSTLRPDEQERLGLLAAANRPLYRAYLLKESLRTIYELDPVEAKKRLTAWLAWASRSRLKPFVKLARTIRKYREGILAAIECGISNGRLEGLNSKVRLLSHRAFGFHSPDAVLALIYLCCSGIEVPLHTDDHPRLDPHLM